MIVLMVLLFILLGLAVTFDLCEQHHVLAPLNSPTMGFLFKMFFFNII